MFTVNIDADTYLALLEQRHAQELFDLVDRNRDHLGEWLSFPSKTTDVQDTEAFIQRSLQKFTNQNGYWCGIWHKQRLAGSIGYLYMDWTNKKTEIGYWLGKKHEGSGLVTKACKVLIQHAFVDLELHKVEINMAEDNQKSRVIPRKLGFTEEGTIRSFECLNGIYKNRVVYGLLREEWEKKIGYQ